MADSLITDYTATYISTPKGAQIESARSFSARSRKELFPMLCHEHLPKDLQAFEETYNNGNPGVFLMAGTKAGQIIGCIAAIPYDHRFGQLQLASNALTYEVCRLYVLPSFRHQNIGRSLFAALHIQLQNKSVKQLYLHTHPFLDGAQSFWEKMGFQLLIQDPDKPFYTIHMQQLTP
ncbi:GNAT family N-acetyltransferase [Pedobacter sp. N36a]|uniref:GNAT family N-acetyltransferase n=1 Tax=Pedobacter sp. N36a TaxID=2767996 RepID=UPI00165694C2|nr:GNAT family N-acetyltransferase [Pedobacter sp. N36a]MBC8988228.1 GNAT family N-acetyltransferase [Pedobacter sp. N36a]